MRENRLSRKIHAGDFTLGTRLLNVWPGFVEIVGNTGLFDYVEFLGEYAPWTLDNLDNFARAAELCGISSMIKIDQYNRAFIAQRAIGAGIQNVLFSDVRSADEVRDCVRIVRAETPGIGGLNGAANRRCVGYYREAGSENYVKALEDSIIAVMIEKREAVENLEEILSVKGIDMVQFGPGDYSLSLGYPGQRNHPEVKAAELKVIRSALDKGIRPRMEIGSINYSKEDLHRYLDLGVKDFHLPSDGKIVYEWLAENGRTLRGMLK